MKKRVILIAILIIGILMLSACGLFPKKDKDKAEEVVADAAEIAEGVAIESVEFEEPEDTNAE